MATDRRTRHHDAEPPHAASPTARLLDELQLYGHRPYQDEPDPRPLPEAARLEGALADIFDALVATLSETRLEPDLADLLWSQVNLFRTLSINAKARLVPAEGGTDKAPDFRVFAAGGVELGAAWSRKAKETGRDYLSVKLDAPSFPQPIYASLAEAKTEGSSNLIWSR